MWAAGLTVLLVLMAISSVVGIISTDNDRVTPAIVRDFSQGVVEVTGSLVAIIWGVWYWIGRKSGRR